MATPPSLKGSLFPLLCPSGLETRSPDPKKIRPFSSVALSTFIIIISFLCHHTGPELVLILSHYHPVKPTVFPDVYFTWKGARFQALAQGYVCEACFVSNACGLAGCRLQWPSYAKDS